MFDFPQTRQSLLLELGRRSDDAWTEFLVVYETAIYRVCRSKGLQDADARDVTQEVLSAVHQRIGTWDPDSTKGSFRAWLVRVAHNISVDLITERARDVSVGGGSEMGRQLMEVADERESEEAEFDSEYRRSLFEWAAEVVQSEVQGVTWKAFQLTTVQGLSAEEVASELEIPIGSVYTANCRVVARIRSKVKGLEPAT
jgi:RNA polymerase sigma-70 factor, ECF subfamily